MQILTWKVEPELVEKGRQNGTPEIKASSPCPCGCSPKPFVLISDGQSGLTARFENQEELDQFKLQVTHMKF